MTLYKDREHFRNMSGGRYVPARERYYPVNVTQLEIVSPDNCDHTSTVCPTKSCISSWENDWELLFSRTIGGHKLEWAKDKD